MNISFYNEEVDLPIVNQVRLSKWLIQVAESYGKMIDELSYIFCSDPYLLKINNDYLNHDYYTDVITFDYCEEERVSGDIFVSLDMIAYNAEKFGKSKENELMRVVAHGLLHLCGLKDKSDLESAQMRAAEEKALVILESI